MQLMKLLLVLGGLVAGSGPGLAVAQSTACATAVFEPTGPLVAAPNSTVAVAYETQAGTGYSWTVVQPPASTVATLAGSEVLPAAVPRPGAPERQCFVFDTVGSGMTDIEFAYRRPFEAGVAPARTASVHLIASAGQVPIQVP
jgi:predicted secreted protein